MKADLIRLVSTKRRLFATEYSSSHTEVEGEPSSEGPVSDGEKLLRSLELLERSLIDLPEEMFTLQFCQDVASRYPALNSSSLTKALQGGEPSKAPRRRNALIHRCEECGGPIAEGECQSCRRATRVIDPMTDRKAKGSSGVNDIEEKVQQFESELDILLGNTPLPTVVLQKEGEVLDLLGSEVVKGEKIPTLLMRHALAKAKLNQYYIWCTAMTYHLTGWRPTPFTPAERSLLVHFYRRTVQTFFRRMNQGTSESGKTMSNLWSGQAIMKLIISSTPSLMVRHCDFYESLHSQSTSTESEHRRIWQEMADEDGWSFNEVDASTGPQSRAKPAFEPRTQSWPQSRAKPAFEPLALPGPQWERS